MLCREQTFAPRAFHSELQQQTNTKSTHRKARLEPAVRDAQKLAQNVFPPWMLDGVLATVVNLAHTACKLMWNMTLTVICHVFGGKLFGNPRFFGREIGNWRSKKKAKLFWTSTQVLHHLLALKKSLSFALASPGKTFIFMHNST